MKCLNFNYFSEYPFYPFFLIYIYFIHLSGSQWYCASFLTPHLFSLSFFFLNDFPFINSVWLFFHGLSHSTHFIPSNPESVFNNERRSSLGQFIFFFFFNGIIISFFGLKKKSSNDKYCSPSFGKKPPKTLFVWNQWNFINKKSLNLKKTLKWMRVP